MHVHILGICGTFMAGVAALAKGAGHRVTGCDANVYPPMSTQLERMGIALIEGYDPGQLDPAPDVVVIGNAMSRGNPLVEAILDRGLAYTSGPAWLADHVLAEQHVIAVAGTHGKTTTASLVAWILEHAGLEPGFLIGGVPANFDVTARVGAGRYFVVEADEYDTAFFDKRAKFVHYKPRTLILNNLEYDHADIYKDIDAILWQVHQLLRTVPASGRIIANGGDDNIRRALEMGCWTRVETFGIGGEHEWNGEFADAGQRRFRLAHGAEHASGSWQLSGEHNLENAIAAAAAAASAGVALDTAADALAAFGGVKRRLERTATVGDIAIYDDFAHHPTAIRRTIAGLRQRYPGQRIVVALEPRSNTMKMGVHNDTLRPSLAEADLVFVYRPPGFAQDFDDALLDDSGRIRLVSDYDELVSALQSELGPHDRLVFMSNGGFGAVRQKLTLVLQRGDQA
jgi:UDP-N-acetylmuramate: L-alanyl-gamma-D-glutamyl-meso-diaminopimelate ligase